MSLKELEKIAEIAKQAGKKIMEIYAQQNNIDIDLKKDGSPVSLADKEAEKIIIKQLKILSPDIQIISEENANSHQLKPENRYYLVDPLDGTKEFIKKDGKGSFTVNIALIENKIPILGVVYAPALDRMFMGKMGSGAWEIERGEKKSIKVNSKVKKDWIAVASLSHRDEKTNQWLNENNIKQTLSIGSSLKLCLVANGEADVYPRFGPTMEWDTAAGDAVLRSAGGITKNENNEAFQYSKAEFRNSAFIAYSSFHQ